MVTEDSLTNWPDLILEITTMTNETGQVRYAFRGIANGARGLDLGSVDGTKLIAQAGEVANAFNEWADPERSRDVEAIEAHLGGLGIGMFKDGLPKEVQDYYWSDLSQTEGKSILLVTDRAASPIPWEIAKPDNEGDHDKQFWCEQFAIARWLPDHPVAEMLPGSPVRCVLGTPGLRDVSRPVEEALGVASDQVIQNWSDLQTMLSTTGLGILNWTGHGVTNPEQPSLSMLPIGGETFRPLDIQSERSRRFAQNGPWVFLHACSSGRVGDGPVSLGGWPMDLIDAGVGAVLCTAWDVRGSTGVRFAAELYPRLVQGTPVAEAVRQARMAVHRVDDPSWLAYHLYAYPLARIAPDRKEALWSTAAMWQIIQPFFGGRSPEETLWRKEYLARIAHPVMEGPAPRVALKYSAMMVEGASKISQTVPQEFGNIGDALRQHSAIALLGAPGSGKTTALQQHLVDLARRGLAGDGDAPTPIYVPLYDYQASVTPLAYLQSCCRDPQLCEQLEHELLAGRVCLLCDGVNEMPRDGYFRKVRAWNEFMGAYHANQYVFACRTLSYENELHCQQLAIDPLDDERIRRYLASTLADRAESAWQTLKKNGLLELARLPLFLEWIAQQCRSNVTALPQSKGRIFAGIANSLLRREREMGLHDGIDIETVADMLAEIAYLAQASPVSDAVPIDTAIKACSAASRPRLAQTPPEAALSFAVATGLLCDLGTELRFDKLQFREYFAALALRSRFLRREELTAHWTAPRLTCEIVPDKEQEQEQVGPLPGPPALGWEESTILAAGLLDDPQPLLEAVCAVNPLLAGRCAADVSAQVSPTALDAIQQALLREIDNDQVHLRVRVATGQILGQVGDPRLKRKRGAGDSIFIAPPLVSVLAGIVQMGSPKSEQSAFDDERPRHPVAVAAFKIGCYPVTNAEFRCFVRGGGYNQQRHWTSAGWQWRQNIDDGKGSIKRFLRNLDYFRDHPDDLKNWLLEGNLPESRRAVWRRLASAPPQDAPAMLEDLGLVKLRSRERPAYVDDQRLDGENQPVVGVTWHEAMAYCSWLSELSGESFALPTEPQWEYAARGDQGWTYPWGLDWDHGRCNALPERIMRPTPIGTFPSGNSPWRCQDMAGNVFEWTLSLYRAYPYDPRDGRESVDGDGVRVNRGGGWDSIPRVVRCALRGDMCTPDTYDVNLGFRVVTR